MMAHDVGYTVVNDIVREWKRQCEEVVVPLVSEPADSARSTCSRSASMSRASGATRAQVPDAPDALAPRLRVALSVSGSDAPSRRALRAFAHFGVVPHRLVHDNLDAELGTHLR